jgi:hypothetical protein
VEDEVAATTEVRKKKGVVEEEKMWAANRLIVPIIIQLL